MAVIFAVQQGSSCFCSALRFNVLAGAAVGAERSSPSSQQRGLYRDKVCREAVQSVR